MRAEIVLKYEEKERIGTSRKSPARSVLNRVEPKDQPQLVTTNSFVQDLAISKLFG